MGAVARNATISAAGRCPGRCPGVVRRNATSANLLSEFAEIEREYSLE
jgi:hypothetical protein